MTLDKAGYLFVPAGLLILLFTVARGDAGSGEQAISGLSLLALGLVLVTGKRRANR